MAPTRCCSTCGAPIPVHAPGGHCPACLLRMGLGEANDAAGGSMVPVMPGKIRQVGDYELIEPIARGGMGIVYRARQLSLNRLVAVKMIRAGEFADEADLARFHAEAEAAAQLDHPNIVPIYEVGEQEGQHYFSMKLVEGRNLAEIIKDGWPSTHCPLHRSRSWLAPERAHCCPAAAQLLARVARAVHYAHQRGILHRDLKPGNILLDAQGEPHVTDFGLAARVETDSVLILSGTIAGTPAYMAPEQAAGTRRLTTAADIYSLGAVLYELLTGRPPFVGATVLDTLMQVREREPILPSVVRRNRHKEALASKPETRNPKSEIEQSRIPSSATEPLDRDLETICLKCLEKDPARRFGSAEALADDLERWLEHRPIRARSVTSIERVGKWMRRKPALAAMFMALCLVVATGLSGILWEWHEAEMARSRLSQELWRSHLTRAQAERQTLALGRRMRSLEAIGAAAAMQPARELRDAAAAALALTDLHDLGAVFPHPLASGLPEWALDPQGVHLALTSQDAVKLRRVADGRTVSRLSHDEKNTRFLRFSPDGRSLAVKYFNRDFVVWDVATRKPRFVARLAKNRGEDAGFFGLDFSADSRVVGCDDRGGLFHLYDAATGRELRTLQVANTNRPILMARFNPRFDSVALVTGDLIEVWALTGELLARRTNLLNAARIAWHPDGSTLAYVNWYEPEIVLWNTRSGAQHTLHSGQGSQFYLAFAPQGDLLATRGLDGITRLWDLATEQVIVSTETAAAFDFIADGTRLGFDRPSAGVGVWDVVRSPVFENLRSSEAPPNVALQTLFSNDGRRLVWRAADGVYGCDMATGAIERGPVGWVHWLCPAETPAALWGATLDGVVQWEDAWKPGARDPRWLRSGANWRWVEYLPRRRLLAIANETNVTVLALPERNEVFATNVYPAKAWAISPDGTWLAVAVGIHQDVHEEQTLVFDLRRQRQAACLTVNAFSLAFDPIGRWLATGSADGFRLWELGPWREIRRFPRQSSNGRVLPMAFTCDGRWFAYARASTVVELAEAETGRSLIALEAPERLQVRGLAFDPSGVTLAAAVENGVVQRWNLAALRRELSHLGLDWPEQGPSAEFAPHR